MLYDKAFSINMNISIWQSRNKEFCDNLNTLAEKSSIPLEILFRESSNILEFFSKKISR